MSIEDIGSAAPKGLCLNNHSITFLKEIAKWTKFLSIIGFVGIGLMILVAFLGEYVSSSIQNSEAFNFEFSGGIGATVFVLVLSVIYFLPVYYLYKFANNMKSALESKDDDQLTSAFEMLKSHYKFLGIFTIVILSIYLIIFLVGFMAAISV